MIPYDLQDELVNYKGKTYIVDDADYSEISLVRYGDETIEEWFEVPWKEHKKMEVIKCQGRET